MEVVLLLIVGGVAVAALLRAKDAGERVDGLQVLIRDLDRELEILRSSLRSPRAAPPAVPPAEPPSTEPDRLRDRPAPPTPSAERAPQPEPSRAAVDGPALADYTLRLPPPPAVGAPAPPAAAVASRPVPEPLAPAAAEPRRATPAAVPETAPPSASPPPVPASVAAASRAGAAPAASSPEEARPARSRKDVEQVLGAELFLKVGVATLVVGIVLFLGYAFRIMGPAGRVAVGYAVAAGLLGGGLFAERRDRYRAFGRALVAGGWGILYFVTFATHFVPAARVVESAAVAVVALLVVAGAAVGFSLRYREEWTTCASYLLIYLALFLAAVQLEAVFNLVATAIVAVSLAVLAWRMGWDRLLALGTPATWAVVAAWLLPRAFAQEAATRGAAAVTLAAVVGIWAALQLALVERRTRQERQEITERWPVAAALSNLAGPLLAVLYLRSSMEHDPRAAAASAAVGGLLYLVSAARSRHLGRRALYELAVAVGIVALLAAPALYLGVGSRWLSVFWLLELELVLVAGVVLRDGFVRGLAHGGFALAALDLALVRTAPGVLGPAAAPEALRLPLLAGGSALALANAYLLRGTWRAALRDDELPGLAYLYSGIGSGLFALLLWQHVPDLWIAPALAGAALLWIAAGTWLKLRDALWEGSGFVALALVAALAKNLAVAPDDLPISARALPFALAALVLSGASLLLRRRPEAPGFFPPAQLRGFASLATGAGFLFTLALIHRAMPDLGQAAACTALAALCFLVDRRWHWPDVLAEGVVASLVGVGYLVATSWSLEGWVLGLPARAVSVLAAAVFLYVAHGLLRGRARAAEASDSDVFPGVGAPELARLAGGYLVAATLAVAWLAKAEALAYGKNALVALVWGLLGVAYVEAGRLVRSRAWHHLGHALLAAGTVHLFLVNFEQPGAVGPVSLRLLTVLPFLGLLVYVHLTAQGAAEGARVPRGAEWAPVPYLYALAAVVATLLLYELPRGWVVVAWAATAAAALLLWRWRGEVHWRAAATLLALAVVVRGVASNLTVRDVIQDQRINLLALPAACLLLLAGYLVVRRSESGARLEPQTRLAWLLATTSLATAAIVVEANGTAMTVWLGGEGLAVVALGIAVRDRSARLLGLGLLSFCILKLFVYDLRGLEGLARIGSFIVLGVILIAVSYAYTRFRERLKEVL